MKLPLKKPEILSPAGNLEKMKSALYFGADAVYLAGKDFGMRAAADNFTLAEIEEAALYAHDRGKRVYLTVNTVPSESEIAGIKRYLADIAALSNKPDAVICADLGVLSLVREALPGTAVHISTQANTQNHLTCKQYHKLGASRIILSRELSLEQIKKIRENIPPELELECFVHGSMCVSYSGRCLLSNYLSGRDANKGKCAQPCRWRYYAVEEKRLSAPLEVAEGERGTLLFSSRDLCMAGHMDDLLDAGISSFKIEGRMKSLYYAAVITNLYRIDLDRCFEAPGDYAPDPALILEAESVSHREYDTGFFYSRPNSDAKITRGEYLNERSYLAVCEDYDAATGTAAFMQVNKLYINSTVQILTPGKPGFDFKIDNLADEYGNPVYSTPHPKMRFRIRTGGIELRAGDLLREASVKPPENN